jgi:dihydrofolate reductase
MRKITGAINMTLDGFCDHTSSVADEEIHEHYKNLLDSAGVILYGRITYQLMEFWPPLLTNPSGNKAMDEFAVAIDKLPKVVFSHTLQHVEWATARLATKTLTEEVAALRQQPGKDILVGSRSLIITLLNLNLLDELQLCVQPILAGAGLPLFENVKDRKDLKLINTRKFNNTGSMLLYFEPLKR